MGTGREENSAAASSRSPGLSLRRRDQRRFERGLVEFRDISGSLFVDGARPTDPRQGAIGDCYLLCAFSAVAHVSPQRIESMFRSDGAGKYTAAFFHRIGGGQFRQESVTVDGKVPVDVSDGHPIYTRTTPDAKGQLETWPLIAEKAYAAWKGGYNVIGEGGAVEDTLEEITGQPTRMLYVAEHKPEVLWTMAIVATREHWPVAACTYGRTERPGLDELGLHPNHIHVFLGVHTWRGQRIVWLRDPFDKPTCGSLVMPDPNGVFTLSWEHFITYFAEIEINGKKVFDIPSLPYPSATIMQALERSYVFHALDADTKRKLAGDFKRVTVQANECVFSEGSHPDFYYLIQSGSAGVEVRHKGSSRKRRVAVLNAGDQFGEMALINNATRMADVNAVTPLALYKMSAKKFHIWISRHPELVQRFRRRFDLQLWMEKWSKRPITSVSLDTLLEAGNEQMVRKHQVVIRQGDMADSFYVILAGDVEVYVKTRGSARKRVKILHAGDLFGEVAALKRAPRTASVRALKTCRLLRLDIAAAANLMESFEVVQRQLEFIARRRAKRLKKLHRAH